MEKWNGAQPASVESHRVLVWSTGTENWYGEVVWKPVSYHGVPWRAWCGNLSATMEYHGELGAETSQLPWSTMESLVWEPVNTHGVP